MVTSWTSALSIVLVYILLLCSKWSSSFTSELKWPHLDFTLLLMSFKGHRSVILLPPPHPNPQRHWINYRDLLSRGSFPKCFKLMVSILKWLLITIILMFALFFLKLVIPVAIIKLPPPYAAICCLELLRVLHHFQPMFWELLPSPLPRWSLGSWWSWCMVTSTACVVL